VAARPRACVAARSRPPGCSVVADDRPDFSAVFLSGTVAVFAGFNTPLSVLLAAASAVALTYVLTLFGRRVASAGVVYEYLA
jgi:hypothetical protein